MLPSLTAVAFLVRESNPGRTQYVVEAERAARSLGLRFHAVWAESGHALDDAFRAARELGAGALVPMDDSAFTAERRSLVELAERYALPGICPIREFVAEGGLISLGPKYEDIYTRAPAYVDKVLKGAKPADMPVEQPTTFEVVVNLRTAKALGLDLPPSLLARADEVIE
jgi:putative ABC transport system substrate-binding protein